MVERHGLANHARAGGRAGFWVGLAAGLWEAWSCAGGRAFPGLVPGAAAPALVCGIVAAHAFGWAFLLGLLARLAAALFPALARAAERSGLGPFSAAVAVALPLLAIPLARGFTFSLHSLPLLLEGLALAAAGGAVAFLAARRLEHHPPALATLVRSMPLSAGIVVLAFGARLYARASTQPLLPTAAALAAAVAAVLLARRHLWRLYAWVLPEAARATFAAASWLRSALAVSLAVALVAWGSTRLGGSQAPAADAADVRNVLLVTIDTLRADALGCYGNSAASTPNLDALASRGALFEDAHAPSPWTLPSLGALFTSRFPSECGLGRTGDESGPLLPLFWQGSRISPDAPTFAEWLEQAGYATAAVVSNVWLAPRFGFARGFDRYVEVKPVAWTSALRPLRLYPWLRRLAPGIEAERGEASEVTDLALRELARLRRSRFFLWVHYFDPHWPYAAPESGRGRGLTLDEVRTGRVAGRALRDETRAAYAEEVAWTDRHLGRLLAALGEHGLVGSTLVAVTSDHGEEFWEHGGFEHGHSLHREVTRVPLLLAFPDGRHAGKRVARTTSLLDLAPTLLEFAGRPLPPGIRGGSLLAALEGRDDAPAAEAFAESLLYFEERKALRSDRRLVVLHPLGGTAQRFDLELDREERTLAGAADGEAGVLEEQLRAWSDERLREARAGRARAPSARALAEAEETLRAIGYAR